MPSMRCPGRRLHHAIPVETTTCPTPATVCLPTTFLSPAGDLDAEEPWPWACRGPERLPVTDGARPASRSSGLAKFPFDHVWVSGARQSVSDDVDTVDGCSRMLMFARVGS